MLDQTEKRDTAYFVNRITGSWNKHVETILEVGRLLIEARDGLPEDDFTTMVAAKDRLDRCQHQYEHERIDEEQLFQAKADLTPKMLPFGERTAERLIKIAEHPILSNPTHVSKLPPSWGTLYEMTRLPDRELEEMLAEGKINCDTERKEIDEFVKRVRGEGIYFYDRVTQALTMLIPFVKKWPDNIPDEIFDEILNGKHAISDTDLDNVSTWICNLHVAYKQKWADMDPDELDELRETKLHGKAKMKRKPKFSPRKSRSRKIGLRGHVH